MFVQRDEFAQRRRGQPLQQDRVGRTVALEGAVRHQPGRRAFGLDFLRRFAKGQRLRLGKNVGQQNVVVPAERVQRLGKRDEVAGDELGPLMDQLVEGMLAVGARLAPVDRPGLVVDLRSIQRDVFAVALHRQLLEVSREALQVLLIGQDRDGLRAEEVVVPDAQESHEHGQVALERGRAEMLVHLMEAVEHGAEMFGADGDHRREPDRRVHRVAPADPIPELKHVAGVDAELRHLRGVGRDRNEMPGNGGVFFQSREGPGARRVRVGHRLQRRKGLRRDDEQRLLGIKIARGLGEVGAIDVGNEAEGQVALAVVSQGFVRHHRPQVRSADADVDDIADRLAGVALPLPAAHPVGEIGHLIENGMDLGHHVLAIHDDGLPLGGAQGHVQDGPLFGDVDLLAPEHGIDSGPQAGFLRQLQQQRYRLVGNAVLGIIEVDADGLGGQALPALGISREELPKMQPANLLVMGFEGLPCRPLSEWRQRFCHGCSTSGVCLPLQPPLAPGPILADYSNIESAATRI